MRNLFRKYFFAAIMANVALATSLAPGPVSAQRAPDSSRSAPVDIVKAYLRATQARDWPAVYGYLSSLDRRVRDERTFLRSQERFDGFALDFAKSFASNMNIWVIEQQLSGTKARLEVGYRVPTGDEISRQLLGWNPEKLNALSLSEQGALIAAWDKVKKSAAAITIEGRETLNLIRESDGWKIFLDWRARQHVVFKTSPSSPALLEVNFLRNDLLVKSEEPFQIDFRVTNRADRDVVVKLFHVFEPRHIENQVDMIACGSLLPLRLRAGETHEISSSYLLRGRFSNRARIGIIYDFNLVSKPAQQPVALKSGKGL